MLFRAEPALAPLRARIGVALVFFLNGFGYASWVPRLAEIKAELGLSEGQLGLALLAIATGALVAMLLTGALIARVGSRFSTRIAVVAFAAATPLLALAPGLLALAGAFLLFGVASGALDVSMNAQGVAVERRFGVPIMSSFHGMFSLGGMSGAVVAGALAGAGLGLGPHLLLVALVIAAAGVWGTAVMLPKDHDAGAGGPAFARPDRSLAVLGAIAFCALLAEGAVADWSAVYLRDWLDAGTSVAAAAFATFSLTMAAGRFAGDRLVKRWGGAAVVRAGGALAAAGLGGALLIGAPWAAVLGFGLVGAGISCVFPVVLSASAATSAMPAGAAIAAICTVGYLGFLVGPPAIGFTAEAIGLPLALALVVGLMAAIAWLGRRMPQPGSAPLPLEERQGGVP